jgi:hypothetical protein
MIRIPRINEGAQYHAFFMRMGKRRKIVLMRVILVSEHPRVIRIACVEKELI